ncbi:MAG: hypothetical protein ACOC5T_05720 [Elusimicrobiota bacterium]
MDSVEITIFIEKDCPFCNYVQKFILEDLIVRRDVFSTHLVKRNMRPLPLMHLKIIDIEANMGRKESQFFEWYSNKIGGRYTPIVVIGEKIFYLWGKNKPLRVEEQHLSKTDLLKKQIIEHLQSLYDTSEKEETFYIKNHKYEEGGINERVHPFESSRL